MDSSDDEIVVPKKRKDSSDSDNEPEEGVFEVKTVLDVRRTKRGKREFKVHWKGYGSEEDTWEPEANLGGAKDAIAKFLAKKEEDDASSNKGGKKRSRATSMPAKKKGTKRKEAESDGEKDDAESDADADNYEPSHSKKKTGNGSAQHSGKHGKKKVSGTSSKTLTSKSRSAEDSLKIAVNKRRKAMEDMPSWLDSGDDSSDERERDSAKKDQPVSGTDKQNLKIKQKSEEKGQPVEKEASAKVESPLVPLDPSSTTIDNNMNNGVENQSSEHDLSQMDTNKSNGAPRSRSQSSTGTVAADVVNGMEEDEILMPVTAPLNNTETMNGYGGDIIAEQSDDLTEKLNEQSGNGSKNTNGVRGSHRKLSDALHRKPVPTRSRASSSKSIAIATSEHFKSLNWNCILRVGNKLMMHANSGSQQRIIPISAPTEKKLFQLLKTEAASHEKDDEKSEAEGDD